MIHMILAISVRSHIPTPQDKPTENWNEMILHFDTITKMHLRLLSGYNIIKSFIIYQNMSIECYDILTNILMLGKVKVGM